MSEAPQLVTFDFAAGPRRHSFLIEASDVGDVLLRVLDPFAVLSAELASVVLAREADRVSIRIEAEGLDGRRAETLRRRLLALPAVRRVGLGWRAGAAGA